MITDTWAMVKEKIENGHPLSSEKTLIFLFTRYLLRFFEYDSTLVIDFESQPYGNLQGESKYLDLLIYTNKSYKVALEFKLPKKNSNGNSNQTQTRKGVYRDIARLNYLIQEKVNDIKVGVFLFACNEDAYLNNDNIKKYPDFRTKESHVHHPSINLLVDGLILPDKGFEFHWENIRFDNLSGKYMKSGSFAYLKPIVIIQDILT